MDPMRQRIRTAAILTCWALTGVISITSTWGSGRSNGATLFFVVMTVITILYLLLRESSVGTGRHPANAVKDELEARGFAAEVQLEDGWILFVRAEDEMQVRVRRSPDRAQAEVQTGRLLDPWVFEYDAAWRVGPGGRIPASLVDAVG